MFVDVLLCDVVDESLLEELVVDFEDGLVDELVELVVEVVEVTA